MKEKFELFTNELILMFQSTKEFVLDQAPSVAREIVLYYRVYGIIELILLSIVIYLLWKTFRYSMAKAKFSNGPWELGVIFSALLGFFCVIGWFYTLTETVKVWTAPKLYLLEYSVDLLKEDE